MDKEALLKELEQVVQAKENHRNLFNQAAGAEIALRRVIGALEAAENDNEDEARIRPKSKPERKK